LPARAERLGRRLLDGLRAVAQRYPKLVLDAPGIGLVTGLRVRNPAVETAITIGLGKRGVHVGHSMNESARHPVLRFYPPLTVSETEIDEALSALNETMTELGRRSTLGFDLMNQIVKRQFSLPPSLLFRLAGVKRDE